MAASGAARHSTTPRSTPTNDCQPWRLGRGCERVPQSARRDVADTLLQHQGAPECDLIARVEGHPEMGGDVLHVGLLEEAHSAADLVRDIGAQQRRFDRESVGVCSVENRDLSERRALVAQLQGALDDEVGFLVRIVARHQRRQCAGVATCLEFLLILADIAADAGVGQGENLRRRPVVHLELEGLGAWVAVGKLQNVVVVGAAKRIDALAIVAHHHEVSTVGLREGLDDLALDGEQVVVVHRVGFALACDVALRDRQDLFLPVDEVRISVDDQILERNSCVGVQ